MVDFDDLTLEIISQHLKPTSGNKPCRIPEDLLYMIESYLRND